MLHQHDEDAGASTELIHFHVGVDECWPRLHGHLVDLDNEEPEVDAAEELPECAADRDERPADDAHS